EDRDAWADGDDVVAELHTGIGATLEEVIGFREALMIVQASVRGNIRDVDRSGEVGDAFERTVGSATRALDAGDGCEIDDFVRFGSGHDLNRFVAAKLRELETEALD